MKQERGSTALEMAILAPALLSFLLLIVFGGRYALATQSVNAAAAASARAASIERNATAAKSSATTTAAATLANQAISCLTVQTNTDTAGFRTDPGTAASITVTVTCELSLAGLTLIGVPGSMTITASSSSPLDTYRERQ